jgi:hypothetical protein
MPHVKREVIEANKTTLWSAWSSLFKKDLTGPTLLEMSGLRLSGAKRLKAQSATFPKRKN